MPKMWYQRPVHNRCKTRYSSSPRTPWKYQRILQPHTQNQVHTYQSRPFKRATAASMRARIRTCNLTPEKQYTISESKHALFCKQAGTEANRFMALLLHPATEIQDYAQCGYTLYQIADICGLTPELVEYIITTYNRNDAASSWSGIIFMIFLLSV